MKKEKIFILALLSVFVFASGLVWAGGEQDASEDGELSGVVSIWKFGGTPKEQQHWVDVNERFQIENPGVKINHNYYYGQIQRTKIIGGFQTKKLADIVFTISQLIPDFSGLNIIRRLDEINPETTEEWKNNIVPEIWGTGVYQEGVWGLAMTTDMPTFLAYNLDAFEEAGLSGPPKNWTELKQYAAKLTQPGRPGIGLQASLAHVDATVFEGIAYANGGRFLDEEKGKIQINQPGFVDALQLYYDLIEGGYTNSGLTETRFREGAFLFGEGKVAMWPMCSYIHKPWFPEETEDLKWGSTLFPKPDTVTGSYAPAATVMDSSNTAMITTMSKNVDLAMKVLDMYASPEELSFWDGSGEFIRIPGYKGAYDSPEFQKRWPELSRLYQEGKLFEGSLPTPTFLGIGESELELSKAIQKVALLQTDPQTALDEAAKNAQDLYDLLHN